jgi:hypothetical protein
MENTSEAGTRLDCQWNLWNLQNSKNRYFTHKNPPLDHNLSQLNSISQNISVTNILVSASYLNQLFQSVVISCITVFITLFINNVNYYYHKGLESSCSAPLSLENSEKDKFSLCLMN